MTFHDSFDLGNVIVTPVPTVSIGLPVYNGEMTLRHSIDSLLAQTFKDFELIISDNASTDSTELICIEFAKKDQRIRYVRQTENRGNLINFQFVLDESVGEYFMWAACDDFWDKNYISECMQIFFVNKDCVSVFSHFNVINYRNNQVVAKATTSSLSSNYPLVRMRHLLQEMTPNLLYGLHKVDVMKKIKLEYYDWSDILFIVELSYYGKIFIVPKFLYNCGINGDRRKPYSLTGKNFDFTLFKSRLSSFIKDRFTLLQRIRILIVIYYRCYIASKSLNRTIKNWQKSR